MRRQAAGLQGKNLRITEIFASLQGETQRSGLPTTFVRLTGCPLRCLYCDTRYAFHGGTRYSLAEVLARVHALGMSYVTVTGGEPLAQSTCLDLLRHLCDRRYQVSLETSGALPLVGVDPRVMIVMDLKTPSSGEVDRNLWSNLEHLRTHDEIKCVLGGIEDYRWIKAHWQAICQATKASLTLSPVWGQLSLQQLSAWVLADRLPVRVQTQLHKLIWGDKPGC